jgi:hypothetical protein
MSGELQALNAALARSGEDIILTRTVRRSGSDVAVPVTCRAVVRALKAEEVVGNFQMSDQIVILSPSQMFAASWPGQDDDIPVGSTVDHRIPRANDIVRARGRDMRVILPKSFFVNGELVRIELVVRG